MWVGKVNVAETTEKLTRIGEVKVTSYNAEVGQTDSTPCIAGGTGINVCERARNGDRVIALSQDLLAWSVKPKNKIKAFSKNEKVYLKQIDGNDHRCNGWFSVVDAMNYRYNNRADLFFLKRSDNTSCRAEIFF